MPSSATSLPRELVTHTVHVRLRRTARGWQIEEPDPIFMHLGRFEREHDIVWEFESGHYLTTRMFLKIIPKRSGELALPCDVTIMPGLPFVKGPPKGGSGHKLVRSAQIKRAHFSGRGPIVKAWCYKIQLFDGLNLEAETDPWIVISKP